jgi:phosphoribosylformimino-5-aminoimidazole carboxamide ribotide isomerase
VKIIPSIDLLGGAVVRLERGDRERATVYGGEPERHALDMSAQGAERVHVVDLDAAFGERRQRELIEEIIRRATVPVQIGGGLRDRAAIEDVFALGAAFAVLGTAAVRSPALVEEACRAHVGRVIVAVDAKDGIVAIDGWTKSGEVRASELGKRAVEWGAAALLYTDIARDGVATGPNVAATAALQREVACDVIASGGVGALADVVALRDAGVRAVVIGRAIYERRFSVADAVRVARGAAP